MNNKGFIAISLIYSFFLVFLMTILIIVADYTHNRILLNDIKRVTQNDLDGRAFNPIALEDTIYSLGETITYANEEWVVLNDNGNSVTLMLNRNLTTGEIEPTDNCEDEWGNKDYHRYSCLYNEYKYYFIGIETDEKFFSMCLNGEYNSAICSYKSSSISEHVQYNWDNSVVFYIINYWFDKNALLQKAKARGTLISMNYSDGTNDIDGNLRSYETYIRIPTYDEFATENYDIWTLSYSKDDSDLDEESRSHVYLDSTNSVTANDTYMEIRPVIEVIKKTT